MGGDVIRVDVDHGSELRLPVLSEKEKSFAVAEGAAFFELARVEEQIPIGIQTGEAEITPRSGSVLSVEAYTGSQNVDVYAGTAGLLLAEDVQVLQTVDHATILQTELGSELTVSDIVPSELRGFLLRELITRDGLCFGPDDLNEILELRAEDTAIADPAWLEDRMTCTIEIRCDTVVSELDTEQLALCGSGEILPVTQVKFSRGESVFEILQRTCRTHDIPLRYTYTVNYGGYYVSEVSGLREIEHGALSGWLYRVNGWYPNFGSSKYEVNEGDVIVWVYTCDGGADLGRGEWIIQR